MSSTADPNHREKRFLIFPRGNPTRHQFIAGIGMPVDIEPESMTVGYVFKAQYFLPYNVTHLYPTRFDKRSISHRFIENESPKSEHSVQIPEDYAISNDSVRWKIYQILSLQLQKFMKVDGVKCIQMNICEASQSSFSYEGGLLSEILHILLVPSTTTQEKNDYTYAEEIGMKNENCQEAFASCKLPFLNYLSKLFI